MRWGFGAVGPGLVAASPGSTMDGCKTVGRPGDKPLLMRLSSIRIMPESSAMFCLACAASLPLRLPRRPLSSAMSRVNWARFAVAVSTDIALTAARLSFLILETVNIVPL